MTRAEGLPTDATARVITVSDRSHTGLRPDASGPALADLLAGQGFAVAEIAVVPDEADAIEAALRAAIDAAADLVVTTGGTGLSPRDVTPEATRRVIDREAPGLAEALRQYRRDELPTTILSRAVAGIAGSTLVLNLPGSTGGVRDGAAVLAPVIGHAIAQLRGGGDHR
ncbi:MAG TPA: MogA/MoaB family molybdenum cofactor biosynthesis protein [Mycobacteriales bacterium]|jgi:molybdenum cofactor biosynthesis protein B|nr:MogA/MoaB family molybdenum cofactor biosynthesis protein [Mycobacteriales bacterium]